MGDVSGSKHQAPEYAGDVKPSQQIHTLPQGQDYRDSNTQKLTDAIAAQMTSK